MNVIHGQTDITVRAYNEPRDVAPFVDALARFAGRLIVGPDECAHTVSLGKGEKTAQTPPLVWFADPRHAAPRETATKSCTVDQVIEVLLIGSP